MKRTREAVLLLGTAIGLAASASHAEAETLLPGQHPFAVAQAMRGGGGGGGGATVDSEEERRKEDEGQRRRRQHQSGGGGAQPQPHYEQPMQRVQDNRDLEIRRRAQQQIHRKADDEMRRRGEQDDARRRDEDEARRRKADDARHKAQEETFRKREDELRRMREEGLRRKTEQNDARRRAADELRRKTEQNDAHRRAADELRRKTEQNDARRRAADELRRKKEQADAHRRAEDPLRHDGNRAVSGPARGDGEKSFRRKTGAGTPLILPKPTVEELDVRRRHRREFAREHLKDVARQRREQHDASGRTVIVEPGNRQIVKERGRTFIRHDETERFREYGRNFRTEDGPRGQRRTVFTRPDGIVIITVVDKDGHLIRRLKRYRDGRQVVLIDNRLERRRHRHRRGVGGFGFFVELPPPVISIPREQYYVDADQASEDDIYDALSAPPLDDIEADYTLDEIRHSPSLRDRLRRVTLSSINFEFGSWELSEDQINRLENVARAIRAILRRNPDEMFLIGGHTDAVGSDEDNLSLSDRRAEAVARVLTDEFGIPAENLVTQGYGEQYLLVDTQEPEVRNRRVEFQRITPALARNGGADQDSGDQDGGDQNGDTGDYGPGDDGGRQ